MTVAQNIIPLQNPENTAQVAAEIGAKLVSGDTLLLEGPIGAGKTHFARHLIQSLQDVPEDVPSPTFTLVQTYDTTAGELWHADLYRLTALDEIEELGLADAFETAICLVEWPDRLGDLAPPAALRLTFETDPSSETARTLTCVWSDSKWPSKLEQIHNV
ncbi:tRNA (adenosine(37)-N6)-threonylcarbamoyltransferase complex ATPase subunit type 1 TsaE [Sedimentitalea todarodis]|uniref:tRNA threonylcarbamoyladenosine biosynthesis protein TsaE n=1 Tax=Sedimentitalea todarodis TaxID=1631240 RepID=A0ABU3VIM2_9RHOB|nr:tRNA (adenosine(37)-N6)-threonylcarbamoyltransferase complex ATPase subunit type 1 TsaE [Sedimentitalea todarodis]MDU9006036.1 tRNA (adenosine(37)-N6)-threonylcarbamoyltransferase complex ATPase subunit type 1 TsaE [Sedimentitalea todarodis]